MLDGISLHYFEKRDGDHLGTIPLAAAQIGRQHKNQDSGDKAYRHAFLIIEDDKRKSGSPPRHVLCAESDADRDSWVQALVRAVRGEFIERTASATSSSRPPSTFKDPIPDAPRPSTSSSIRSDIAKGPEIPRRQQSKDNVSQPLSAQPLSNVSRDDSNAKLFDKGVAPMLINAREDRKPSVEMDRAAPSITTANIVNHNLAMISSASAPADVSGRSSSLSVPLELSTTASKTSNDPEHLPSPSTTPIKNPRRQSMMPLKSGAAMEALKGAPPPRAPPLQTSLQPTREIPDSPDRDQNRIQRDLISGPTGGAPIPAGFRFGAIKDQAEQDKERKHKSMRLWGFGKQGEQEFVDFDESIDS